MYDKALPSPLRLAQAIGITSSAFAAGVTFAGSYFLIPRLLESPTPIMVSQWRKAFWRGAKTVIPIGVTSALSYLYLAYQFHSHNKHSNAFSAEWKVNFAAGLLSFGTFVYTATAMADTNNKLLAKASEMEKLSEKDKKVDVVEIGLGEETAHKLVDKWASLNLGRSAIFMLSTAAGTYAALG